MKKKRFEIRTVSNGYILSWLDYGENEFKEPYEKEVVVFTEYAHLELYIREHLDPASICNRKETTF